MDTNRVVTLRLLSDSRQEPNGLTPAENVIYDRLRTTKTVAQLAAALAGGRFHGLTVFELSVLVKATGGACAGVRGMGEAA